MQAKDYFHLNQKYREFFQMHVLAAVMMIIIYIAFSYFNIEPHLLKAFNLLIPFNLLMAFCFHKKYFKNHLTGFFFFTVVVESLMWTIYPRLAGYTPASSFCYIAAIIILAFHLQHTNIKYCLLHFLIISFNNFMLDDPNLVLITFLHIFITTVSSIQSIIFRNNATEILHKKEFHKNILNLKSYFAHNLLNPINNILNVFSSGIEDRKKIEESLIKNSSRIEDFLDEDFDDVDHLLDYQVDIFNIPIFNNFKKSSIIVILSICLFYMLYTIDIHASISNISYTGLAIVINFLVFAFHLYKTKNHYSIQKVSFFYLLIAQILFSAKYYFSHESAVSLSLLLSSLLFTIVLAANTREKYIYILSTTACLLSLVTADTTHIIMFISFIIYFTKVVLGFYFKHEIINARIKDLVKQEISFEYSNKIEKNLIPLFRNLKKDIDNFIMNSSDNLDTEVLKSAQSLTEAVYILNQTDENGQTDFRN
ncbi:putative membrane protein [Halobacteriovorax sp. BALOs_7]|uniref:hypothetical protein n=1 Tax=Halobacteriovorax sp. BALOs_7 TaxID=2109558 RepID=UPI000EA0B6B8|nr:hypothetical protein [Halobacteriovorax sp. BALOs_7]AYF43412.1 putative membrane protein [Halobacteriovorax sp. BALOs_7]